MGFSNLSDYFGRSDYKVWRNSNPNARDHIYDEVEERTLCGFDSENGEVLDQVVDGDWYQKNMDNVGVCLRCRKKHDEL